MIFILILIIFEIPCPVFAKEICVDAVKDNQIITKDAVLDVPKYQRTPVIKKHQCYEADIKKNYTKPSKIRSLKEIPDKKDYTLPSYEKSYKYYGNP